MLFRSAVNLNTLLTSLGVKSTPENAALARELLSQEGELTPASFKSLQASLAAFPELEPSQAVFMQRHQMPITALSVRQFQGFLQHQTQIGQQLAGLLRLMESAELPAQDAPSLPQAQSAPPPASPPQAAQPSVLPPLPEGRALPEAQALPQEPLQQGHSASAPLSTASPPQESATPALASPPQDAPLPSQAQAVPSRPVSTPPQEPPPPQSAAPVLSPEPAPVPSPTLRSKTFPSPATAQTSHPPEAEPPSVPAAPPLSASGYPQPSASPLSLRQWAATLFREIDPQRNAALPKELNAQRLVQELDRFLSAAEAAEWPDSVRGELAKAVQDIAQQVKFIDQLNSFTHFIQMPLMVNGEKTTADLYVFNDSKGQKRIDPNNATLFLSLSTAGIGRVETFVKLIGKSAEADFSLDTEPVAQGFSSHMTQLRDSLQAQGFTLVRTSARTSPEPMGPPEVEREHRQRSARYHFDRSV